MSDSRESHPPGVLLALDQKAPAVEALPGEPGTLAHRLLERAQSAELVSRFAQAIATQFTLPQIVATAMVKARDLVDADGAALLLVDPATGDLVFDFVSGTGQGEIE